MIICLATKQRKFVTQIASRQNSVNYHQRRVPLLALVLPSDHPHLRTLHHLPALPQQWHQWCGWSQWWRGNFSIWFLFSFETANLPYDLCNVSKRCMWPNGNHSPLLPRATSTPKLSKKSSRSKSHQILREFPSKFPSNCNKNSHLNIHQNSHENSYEILIKLPFKFMSNSLNILFPFKFPFKFP